VVRPTGVEDREVPRQRALTRPSAGARNDEAREKMKPKEAVRDRRPKGHRPTREPVPWRKALESSHLRSRKREGVMVNGRRAGVRENRGDTADCCGRGEASKGGAPRKVPKRQVASATRSKGPQRDEPQDRLRGATNPQDARRRKPSRWWETTKAEQDRLFGKSRPKRGGTEARA